MYRSRGARSRLGLLVAPADPATQSYIVTMQDGTKRTIPPGQPLPSGTVSFVRGPAVSAAPVIPRPIAPVIPAGAYSTVQPTPAVIPAQMSPSPTAASTALATITTDSSLWYWLGGAGLLAYLLLRR